ncbi:formate dehydrogenase accessory sulfurtransferase FdhD [Thioalkalivibrio sp.]|uniref:formate dehydrogenase accessory sulfurtransferase FdhD n=1 Tax=Thioalkalivibrio sp. TaxID=2093813 RepID=UPI0035647797
MTATHHVDRTRAGLAPCHSMEVSDEFGELRQVQVAGERPLTLYLNKREIVTLMTLGGHPELLALGYLRNQRLIPDLADVKAVQADWETESVVVTTRNQVRSLEEKLGRRTITTGCGQGTVFGDLMEDLERIRLPEVNVRQSTLYALLKNLAARNEVYRSAGAVHGCALCLDTKVEFFVEDVGRHNAVDAIAGHMWLEDMQGGDRIFYTTGRLTSEMVIKVAQIGVPTLVSRSGVTHMGFDLARRLGVTMIARAKGRHFLVFNGRERVILDAPAALTT